LISEFANFERKKFRRTYYIEATKFDFLLIKPKFLHIREKVGNHEKTLCGKTTYRFYQGEKECGVVKVGGEGVSFHSPLPLLEYSLGHPARLLTEPDIKGQ